MATVNEQKKEWFYLDSDGVEQGPFSLAAMRAWWQGGFFPADLKVRLNREYKFHMLSLREDYVLFKDPRDITDTTATTISTTPTTGASTDTAESAVKSLQHAAAATPPPVVQYREYSIKGRFNNKTGSWESKLWEQPEDRALRQMSHYFDLDQYQRIRSGEEKAPKRKAPTPGGASVTPKQKKQKQKKRLVVS